MSYPQKEDIPPTNPHVWVRHINDLQSSEVGLEGYSRSTAANRDLLIDQLYTCKYDSLAISAK